MAAPALRLVFAALMRSPPSIVAQATAEGLSVALSGEWTIDAGAALERQAAALQAAATDTRKTAIDLSAVDSLDTAGAWVIDRARQALQASGVPAELTGVSETHATLLREAAYRPDETPTEPRRLLMVSLIGEVGASVADIAADVFSGLSFLGQVVACGFRGLFRPSHWRLTPLVFHFENYAFRSVPLIVTINIFVGAIIAQQGIFQLEKLGASAFSTELVAILSLRELGVLLASIMVAGRTGSAITAEIGAMKMREETDALRVMALDPIEVLVLPGVVRM